MDAREHLRRGTDAANAGDLKQARLHLASAVQLDPSLVEAWWGLANLLEDPSQRRECLRRILALDPTHAEAKARMAQESAPTRAPAPSPVIGARALDTRAQAGRPAPDPVRERPPRSRSGRSTWLIAGGVFLGIVLIGGAGLAALLLSGMADGLFARPAAAPVAGQPAALPTLPPEWTATPSPTLAPTLETTPVPTPTAAKDPRVTAAMSTMESENFERAIELWGDILQDDPTNHEAYYQRAFAYLKLTEGLGLLDQYIDHSLAAIADSDRAIALSPEPVGDYYMARSWAFENLGSVAVNRVDQDRLWEVGLENYLIGQSLPTRSPILTGPAVFLVRLGRCEEALQEAERRDRERGEGLAPSPRNHYDLAIAYICLGRFQEAIEHIDVAIAGYPVVAYRYQRAVALYHMGRKTDALTELTDSITTSPNREGYRYYLRALIEYELGDPGRADADLLVGSFSTWSQDSLRAYVEARRLLDQGQRDQGLVRFRQAEVTIDRSHGPFVDRIRRELVALGAQPYSPTALPSPEATPIPALPEDHPVPLPMQVVLHGYGLGEYSLLPDSELVVHFAPPAGFTYSDIQSVRVHVVPVDQALSPDLELFVHNPARDWWDRFHVNWGPNQIASPDQYFYASGSCVIKLHNLSQQAIALQNVGLEVELVDRDGIRARYSFLDR